ncbi:MAG: hypothetical protein ACU0AT_12255 [Tranquillimonas sp.]|jgi:hypothetical protein
MIRAALLVLTLAACQPPDLAVRAEAREGDIDLRPTLAFPGPVTVVLRP